MKKLITMISAGLVFSFTSNSQTLYVPSGLGGVGFSSNPNVGIGTTSPGAKLHVKGAGGASIGLLVEGRIRSSSAAGGMWLSNVNDGFVGNAGGNVGFWTNGVGWNALQIKKSNGFVGIGTTAPVAKLHVKGAGGASIGLLVEGRIRSSSVAGGMWLSNVNDGFVGNAGGNVGFWTNGVGWNALQIKKSNGFVGIGTTAPTARLHVKGAGGASIGLLVEGRIRSSSAAGGMWLSNVNDGFVGNAGGNVGFWTNGVGWNALQIKKSNGFVGIGTTAPTARLHVKGAGGASIGLLVEGRIRSSSAAGGMWLSNVNDGFVGNNGGNVGFWTNGVGWNALQIKKSNGYVGIGTSNPDERLTVKGKIHAEGIIIDLSVPFPDYVFEENYDLRSLSDLKEYVKKNKHLPEIPSAAIVEEKGGIELAEMNTKLLRKVEELTLYLIDQNDKMSELENEIKKLKEINIEKHKNSGNYENK